MIKVIKTEADYTAALAEIERLMNLDPASGTPEAEQLEVSALLVKDYESKRFPVSRPDPIEAIRFRMDQQGLTQRDLVPYMGSRSKVSEVLGGKRSLTLSMIRALHHGLGIPSDALLQEQSPDVLDKGELDWDRFPLREMTARGWFDKLDPATRRDPEAALRAFCSPLVRKKQIYALYKKTLRTARSIDKYSLAAWTVRVIVRAIEMPLPARYESGTVTPAFMRELSQVSWSRQGPLLAKEFLERHGISVVIEPHLPKTKLDGAAILVDAERPVIGLTLRHDRVDNFWFCLMHELAHVSLHLQKEGDGFYDDLDVEDSNNPREREADRIARDALVPEEAWKASPARALRSPEAAHHLAEKLRIHPAIVAGRMRWEAKNFRILNQILGQGLVRQLFTEIQWEKV